MAAIETARRILLLERRGGFRDRAVVGGLDQFVEQARTLALPTLAEPEQRRLHGVLALLEGYSQASPADRRAMLDTAMEALTNGLAERAGPAERAMAARPGAKERTAPVGRARPTRHSGENAANSDRRAAEAPKPRTTAPKVHGVTEADLDLPIERMSGIGASMLPRFHKLCLRTARDLLHLFPSRHMDRASFTPIADIQPGDHETVMGTIWEVHNDPTRRGMARTTLMLADQSGSTSAVWFNQPYLRQTLKPQAEVVLSGKVELFQGRPRFSSPDWELVTENDLLHTGRIVPVYRLTEGLKPKFMRTLMKRAVDSFAPVLPDFLPEATRRRANLMALPQAIAEYHFPPSWEALRQAERRLAFDELLLIQLTALRRRRTWREAQPGVRVTLDGAWLDETMSRLPFHLTGAQRKALDALIEDMASGYPMNRLLEGDVGSGKTVVAALAMYACAHGGYQSLLMAPTEILANQHHDSITRLFDQLNGTRFEAPPRVGLLTGSVKGKQRQHVLDGLADGNVAVAVGTQALIQQGVEVRNLALAIVDEQHRFGVEQRSSLRQKGFNPHLLVMTATPIPRSLGLTLYGDLDISLIDEMPPGRQPIKTKWFGPDERRRAYEFIRKQVGLGRQAFIICPLVEESEKMEVRAATAEYERLRRLIFPELQLGLLHGRLKNREKEEVMERFSGNEIQILVSTSVVEVGVDVPNASAIAIEGADHFGLAQLHQFRGRVGRGQHQSYCILLSDSAAAAANPRLKAIEETQSGFRLAEIDLELRGYGELFGTRQSGEPSLKVARLTDVELIQETRQAAAELLGDDPDLERHESLRAEIAGFWKVAELS
ncbi:MAG: ATP-dependent DNA helicase RecG [Chloroflexota bacterium]